MRALGLAGPTASGKSALAMNLARSLDAEIVSVDSAQVYCGMDIGTAKPSTDDRQAVPHHLIDILEPTQAYSAAQFVADARQLIAAINGRGKVALLVGGTMLYFKALIDGLAALPAANTQVRAELDAQARSLGWPALHARLAELDPDTAARLQPLDAQRIQRALEVFELTGVPMSQLHQRQALPGLPLPLIALEPHSRAWLHARIAQRFDAMLAAGLVDEVRGLRSRGQLHAALPSMRCVGYRQAWAALENSHPDNGQVDGSQLKGLREAGLAATRQLAKRQLTWLRGMPRRHVLVCDLPGWEQDALPLAQRLLQAGDAEG